jgi:hypothetical protein
VDVDRGLKAAADAPVRSGYVQAVGTWNALDGGVGRIEAGVHPWANVTAYAAGTLDRNGPGAEIGARYAWNW